MPGPSDAGPGSRLSLRVRVTGALILTAVLPLAVFALLLGATAQAGREPLVLRLLLLTAVGAALLGLVIAYVLAAGLTAPLRRIAAAVERVAAGEPSEPIRLEGDDELARLADSHNRIAADTRRRNRELAALLDAVGGYSPGGGAEALVRRAAVDAHDIFGLIDARLDLVEPADVPVEETVPGEARPVRADVRAGRETLGVLTGHTSATAVWEPADQHLLELFTSEVGVAVRNAQLFTRIEAQNARLVELDATKDEFLRGVSHNLQTPLTSIRAYVEQLRATPPEPATDRGLAIIAEQTDRLSRMVRQLLTVTRLQAGALRPAAEVLSLAPRVRRAWEALGATGVPFALDDLAAGWLAIADPDQLDQVLWALLDNAVKYGGGSAVEARLVVDHVSEMVRLTIADGGPGISPEDRARLFVRFSRGEGRTASDGTGLGLYLSRALMHAMGGDLVAEPSAPGCGAAFTLALPAEPPDDR